MKPRLRVTYDGIRDERFRLFYSYKNNDNYLLNLAYLIQLSRYLNRSKGGKLRDDVKYR